MSNAIPIQEQLSAQVYDAVQEVDIRNDRDERIAEILLKLNRRIDILDQQIKAIRQVPPPLK